MSSEDLLQRSVRLLDDVVGSPTLYRSPRPSRHRSSLFSNTMLPLRHSDVREYALNTSITMSTSELENFYMDSTSTKLQNQRTAIRDMSDNLYQSFLDSMQTHSSSREVFTTIAEFVQNCNNILKLIIDTNSEQDVQWLELERNNWRLVQALYQNRLFPPNLDMMEGSADRKDMDVDDFQLLSEKEIMQNFYKADPKINEYQLVVDWLEKNAADVLDTQRGPKLHHYMDNTVAWENTLHQLQNETVAYRSSRAIVNSLDPDAPLRESKPLHDLDMEDENRLLKQVWAEVRCGRISEAQKLCHHCGQSWRAATLEGWKLYHDPNYHNKLAITEKQPVEGNLHRDIWKLCAYQLSENIRAGTYARAVYGALCGNLNALLPACETWDDVLWAHTRVLVDQLVEQEIRNEGARNYHCMPDSYWNTKLSMDDTFATLDSSGEPLVRQQARSRERIIQKLLILDQLPQLMSSMLQWAQEQDCSPQMLRFLAHLVLTLRLLGQPASQDIGDEIIKIYVKALMEKGEAEQVAYYTATLPGDDQVTLYAQFLQDIQHLALRKAALDAAEAVNLPVEAITQRVVENIRNEESAERMLPLELSGEVTEEDRRKISALEWVVLYPSQRAEAIWQTNALIRTFLALGKIQAARLAFNQIPPDSVSEVMSQYQVDDETASVYSAFLPTRVNAAIQEYFSHKAYLDAQEGFADWFEDYHHARPSEPPTPGSGATFTERVAHDHRLAAYHKELDRWRAAMEHQTKCVKKQLYNVLFMPDKGWLANSDSDNEDELRTHQMEALRTLCIPKIVLLLHTVLHSTGQYKEAIQLAEIVVDEQRLIYKVYTKQQMGELLSKIRESSLASLTQDKDPWGHPLVS